MQDGKALQCGTSHYLGQNFSGAMEMEFTDEDGERKLCYTTSWGLTTRMVGAVVMTHGDDNGLRVPPRIAPQQVKIVPITRDDPTAVLESARELQAELAGRSWDGAALRVEVDLRDHKPAEKRWEWIRKGVPIVIELGGRDIDQGVVTMTRRDDPELARDAIPREGAADAVAGMIGDIQLSYFEEADKRLRERTRDDITTIDEFREFFSGDDTESGGFVLAPWSEEPETDRDDGRARRQRARHPRGSRTSARCTLRDQRRPRDRDGDLREGVLACSVRGASMIGSEEPWHRVRARYSQRSSDLSSLRTSGPAGGRVRRSVSASRGRCRQRTLIDLIAVVTELVNNAVAHGPGRPITVTLVTADDVIRGEIADQGNPAGAIPRIRDRSETDGGGLELVDRLSSRWAVYEGSTHVWFELPIDA